MARVRVAAEKVQWRMTDAARALAESAVATVRFDLLRRFQLGRLEYGTTLDLGNFRMREWLQHAYEEALDLATYLRCCLIDRERA